MEQNIKFIALVGKRLESAGEEVRSLWLPIAEEFNRGGPDDAKTYLEAQQQSLQERIETLLSQFDEV